MEITLGQITVLINKRLDEDFATAKKTYETTRLESYGFQQKYISALRDHPEFVSGVEKAREGLKACLPRSLGPLYVSFYPNQVSHYSEVPNPPEAWTSPDGKRKISFSASARCDVKVQGRSGRGEHAELFHFDIHSRIQYKGAYKDLIEAWEKNNQLYWQASKTMKALGDKRGKVNDIAQLVMLRITLKPEEIKVLEKFVGEAIDEVV